jgi:hypothetical protein
MSLRQNSTILSSFTRFHKFFFHKNGLSVLIALATFKRPYAMLHWWVYFNLIMSIFFIYIWTVRDEVHDLCDDDFWSNSSKENILKEYLEEYACVVDDRRFFVPNHRVYWYIMLNIIAAPLLLYFLLTADRRINVVLTAQGVAAIVYFATKSWSFKVSLKSVLYTFVSALWIVYPIMLVISLRNK